MSRHVKYPIVSLLLFIAGFTGIAQTAKLERGSVAFFDSLDSRIENLQKQIPRLKQLRDVAYYNLQREIDLTKFIKDCEELIVNEDLDNAKKLVEARIDRAQLRRDQYSLDFYRHYKDDVNLLIKKQSIHYQELFAREKNFKKEFDRLTAEGKQDSYLKTTRMVNLALKYAREKNLSETIKYLDNIMSYTQALIFDMNSTYDLAMLTSNVKEFDKIFTPLVESDSLKALDQADLLLSHCTNYARLTGSKLTPEFFSRQGMVVSSSRAEMVEIVGREKEIDSYRDEAVKARYDTVNPCGVFKWHSQIIVIDEFTPSSSMEAVKKGEAILHADKMLSAYLKKNKLCQSIDDLKFGHAFVIPYQSDQKNSAFYFNLKSQKWQYIACYTSVVDAGYTQRVSKYMPPLFFENEKDMADIR